MTRSWMNRAELGEYDKTEGALPMEDNVMVEYVESSFIEKVEYNPDTMHMVVHFKRLGNVVSYVGVAQETFLEFVTADSPGRFYGRRVKGKLTKYAKQEAVARFIRNGG